MGEALGILYNQTFFFVRSWNIYLPDECSYLAKLIINLQGRAGFLVFFFLEGGFKGIYLRERNSTLSYVVSDMNC